MTVLGVVGAGTMGAGIAQLGAAAGMRTLLHDPDAEALERGTESARRGLSKWIEKGRVGEETASLLQPISKLDDLAPCDARHRGGSRASGAETRPVRSSFDGLR